MATLHNRVSRQELKERAKNDKTPRYTLSFYCYFQIENPEQFRNDLYKSLLKLDVLGRIYIAQEGINAQISCPVEKFNELKSFIYSFPQLDGLRLNKAVEESRNSFYVLDIKVRNKIVADGIVDQSFSMLNKGKYVNAFEFNKLVEDPSTMVIDMRNHYEYEVGRFKTAKEIPSDTFREQLPMAVDMFKENKDRNIIMYCTGGIRCEKASAWMLHNGFKNVFHLEGGIINYINQVREQKLDNHFIGKNFVFDERLGERISEDIIAHCHICGTSCDVHVNCENTSCHLLFIQCDKCSQELEGCCSKECKDFIHLDPAEQKELRKGIDKGKNIFNKSRDRMRSLGK
ncbi:MAG: rhodanese-related sulfurtransferase [bacterium]